MAILIIKKEDLPPASGLSQSYPIRYRLVSEDKSKFSYWSPIFNIPVKKDYSIMAPSVSKSGTIVNTVWNLVDGIDSYDVWIRWSKASAHVGDWFFMQSISNNSVSIIIPSSFYSNGILINETPNRFSVRIYEPTYSIAVYPALAKAQYPPFLIYESLDQVV